VPPPLSSAPFPLPPFLCLCALLLQGGALFFGDQRGDALPADAADDDANADANVVTSANGGGANKQPGSRAAGSGPGSEALQRVLARGLLTGRLTFAFTGTSITAGHDNLLRDSYPAVMQRHSNCTRGDGAALLPH
jgi:hypothetical protein